MAISNSRSQPRITWVCNKKEYHNRQFITRVHIMLKQQNGRFRTHIMKSTKKAKCQKFIVMSLCHKSTAISVYDSKTNTINTTSQNIRRSTCR